MSQVGVAPFSPLEPIFLSFTLEIIYVGTMVLSGYEKAKKFCSEANFFTLTLKISPRGCMLTSSKS